MLLPAGLARYPLPGGHGRPAATGTHPTPTGHREYGPETADRLQFLRRCQAAGLSLREVRQVLTSWHVQLAAPSAREPPSSLRRAPIQQMFSLVTAGPLLRDGRM
ncbi:MerR family transcriptional regulator (plasmid) [Streptomyces sp. NBC_00637]|uniref:MerR family transcriptional regulator n=1 Tax=Streptomyces sp. NBC_00637 TaxID=2903667 RepID=UPI003246D2D3